MTGAPLAAVCTPVYNGEAYLAETMECVQAQTYPNLVHVLLDNASSDATPEIIERFRGRRVPLVVARNPHTVPRTENFNRTLALMPPEVRYFRVLCHDDLIVPDATARMIEPMEEDPDIGLVVAAESDGKWGGWPEGRVFDGLELLARFFRGGVPGTFGHCVYRRRFYDERAPHFLDEALTTSDVDVALYIMCRAKVAYLHEGLVWTREHPETVTTRELWRDRVNYAEWLVQLHRYGSKAMSREEVERLARRFKRYYYRQMLIWRLTDGDDKRLRQHLERLDLARARPTLLDYCDALVDWPLKRLGLRQGWSG